MEELAALLRRLRKVRPWVAVAAVMALGLAGYFGLIGVRYLQADGDIDAMEQQARLLQLATSRTGPDEGAAMAALAAAEQRLALAEAAFDIGGSEGLVAILSEEAARVGLSLKSIAFGLVVARSTRA